MPINQECWTPKLRELCTELETGKEFLLVFMSTALYHLCMGEESEGVTGNPESSEALRKVTVPVGRNQITLLDSF